jgi:hypothetical protein
MAEYIGHDQKFAGTPCIIYLDVTEVCPQSQHALRTTNAQEVDK